MPSPVIIIIPVHNEAKFLSEAITSVIGQAYKNFDLVISCNYCTDESLAIAKRFEALDTRITVFSTPSQLSSFDHWQWILDQIPDKSIYNYGLSIGGHDTISSDYLEALLREIESDSNCALCYASNAYATDEIGRIKFKYPPMPQTFSGNDFFQSIPITLSLRYNILAFDLCRAKLFFEPVYKCYAADHIRIGLFAKFGFIKGIPGPYIHARDTSSGVTQYIEKHFGSSHQGTLHNLAIQLKWFNEIISDLGPTNHPILNQSAKAASLALYILRYLEQFKTTDELNEFFSNKDIATFFTALSELPSMIDTYINAHSQA